LYNKKRVAIQNRINDFIWRKNEHKGVDALGSHIAFMMEHIQTEKKLFDKSLSTLRMTAEQAMRGLGAGDFGG
jgi:hypothetical protein